MQKWCASMFPISLSAKRSSRAWCFYWAGYARLCLISAHSKCLWMKDLLPGSCAVPISLPTICGSQATPSTTTIMLTLLPLSWGNCSDRALRLSLTQGSVCSLVWLPWACLALPAILFPGRSIYVSVLIWTKSLNPNNYPVQAIRRCFVPFPMAFWPCWWAWSSATWRQHSNGGSNMATGLNLTGSIHRVSSIEPSTNSRLLASCSPAFMRMF